MLIIVIYNHIIIKLLKKFVHLFITFNMQVAITFYSTCYENMYAHPYDMQVP